MKGKLCDPIYTTCAGQVEDEPKFLGFFFFVFLRMGLILQPRFWPQVLNFGITSEYYQIWSQNR